MTIFQWSDTESIGGMDPPSEEWLQSVVDAWLPVLSLQAWRVKVRHGKDRELAAGNRGCVAECGPCYSNRTATIIVIMDYDSAETARPDLRDWEQTMVHELLHCQFDPPIAPEMYDLSRCHRVLYEQAIEATALALVNLRREGAKRFR